jgi:hypothetical protein
MVARWKTTAGERIRDGDGGPLPTVRRTFVDDKIRYPRLQYGGEARVLLRQVRRDSDSAFHLVVDFSAHYVVLYYIAIIYIIYFI